MKSSIISVLVSISALALAQDLTGLPTCAQSAALSGAAGSGCSLTDAQCFCKNTGFIDSLRGAISTACTSAADQQAACSWGNSACSSYGVTIPCSDSASSAPADSNNPVTTSSAPTSDGTPAEGAGSSVSTLPSGAAGSPMSSMSMALGSSVTGSMPMSTMMSMTSAMSSMNGTHTSNNMTHSATNKPSPTSAGPTSHYTGAGNAAVRHSGVVGTVFGVALLFAFF